MSYIFNMVDEVSITMDAKCSSNRLYQPGEKLSILMAGLPAQFDKQKVTLQINDDLNNLDKASFDLDKFFRLFKK